MRGIDLASQIKYYLDYCKFDEQTQKVENWAGSVSRVMNMHWNNPKFQEAKKLERFTELFELTKSLYLDEVIGGSMRALQFGGEPIMKHNAKMFNCLNSYCDRVEFFRETAYWLLCGCGVGFSVQTHHIEKLPVLQKRRDQVNAFVVQDSIEGWADAFGVLIDSYTRKEKQFEDYHGVRVVFDFSLIRPKGAYISGGFKAPGHEGLRRSLERCEALLEQHIKNSGEYQFTKLTPIIAYDFVMHMADAVLSGGVRRSATICLFSLHDEEMMKAKTGSWYQDNPQRGRSNNSVVLKRDEVTQQQFFSIFQSIQEFGEPGFYFVNDYNQGTNPCLSGDSWVTTKEFGVTQINDIVGKGKLNILLNGKYEETSSKGFWKTGDKTVFQITMKNGMKIKATENHEFETSSGWKRLDELTIGEVLNISKNNNKVSWEGFGNKQQGWLVGNLIGDGTFCSNQEAKWEYWGEERHYMKQFCKSLLDSQSEPVKGQRKFYNRKHENISDRRKKSVEISSCRLTNLLESVGVVKGSKYFNSKIESCSSEFYKGVIGGFFDADGSVEGGVQESIRISFSQSHLETLEILQRMLLRFGIVSKIGLVTPEGYQTLFDSKQEKKEYWCKANYELRIESREFVERFFEIIYVNSPEKLNSYKTKISKFQKNIYTSKTRFQSKIVSIQEIGVEPVFDCTVPKTSCFDSNGFVVHNCVEIGLWPQTEDGRSGWQGCNLSTINGSKINSKERFLQACTAVAFIGTLQAAYTDFTYVDPVCKEIFDREALLGCSVTGWMNSPDTLLDPELQQTGATLIKQINREVAEMIGINPAARTTCVKPEGNTSVLYKSASGCHGDHSPLHFRAMQINKESEITKHLEETLPELLEECIWSSGGTDYTVFCPVVVKKGSIFKSDLLGIKLLEKVKLIQQNWVKYGKDESLCVKPFLTHNVSNTVDVVDWDEVGNYLWENKEFFSGVSFLSYKGDRVYYQAPFTSVKTSEEILSEYGNAGLLVSGLVVDGLHVFDNIYDACTYVEQPGMKLIGTRREVLLQSDWIRRVKQFSKRYLKNDLTKTILCIKDIYWFHKWLQTTRVLSQKEIDFSKIDLKPVYTEVDTLGAIACAGGSCELPTFLKN